MNELTQADRYDGRSTNGIKGIWYDTESLHRLDEELAALVEHAE